MIPWLPLNSYAGAFWQATIIIPADVSIDCIDCDEKPLFSMAPCENT